MNSTGNSSKEEVQMASKYMKKGSTSLVIKEMQIKRTLRFHLTPVRRATIKGKNNNTVRGIANECNHYGKRYGDSSKS
jgi:hypothetical protein